MLFYVFLLSLLSSGNSTKNIPEVEPRLRKPFYGKWYSLSDDISFLTESSGHIKYTIKDSRDIFHLAIDFRNGIWNDDHVERLTITDLAFDKPEGVLYFNWTYPDTQEIYTDIEACRFEGKIQYHLQTVNNTSPSNGTFTSSNCDIEIVFLAGFTEENSIEKPRVVYNFVLFCIFFAQSFIITRYQELVVTYESIAKKSSFWFWVWNASIDFSIALFNFQEIVRDLSSLESMIMGLIWSLISFFNIRSKLLFLIYHAHQPDISISSAHLKFSRIIVLFCN